MKKAIAIIGLTLASTAVVAQDLKVEGTTFSSKIRFPVIELKLSNITPQDIIAFKGTIICLDPFGDEAIKLNVKAQSANLPAGKSGIFSWQPNMFSEAGKTIQNNNAKNFKCSLVNQIIVN